MAINFPSTTGQATDGSFTHTASGITWAWDGTTWKAQGVTGTYTLPTASATALGGIKVGSGLSINSTTSVLTATAASAETTWNLAASGPNHYEFTGPGLDGTVDDPTLYLMRGQTYNFVNNTSGTSHPFRIQSTAGTGGTAYNAGVTNNGGTNGVTIKFEVPLDAPDTLYYQCTAHANMVGTINVLNQGSSGLTSRKTTAVTTSSIANAASDNITFAGVGKSYGLLKIQVDKAAWVVLYTSQTARTADSGRLETTDPLPGSGVIAEILSTAGVVQGITPGTIGWNDEATPTADVYAKVTNKSGSTGTVAVTLTTVQLEA